MTITTNDNSVTISRDPGSNKVTCNRIHLIKLVREITFAGLKDSKDFVDMFLKALENLQADKARIQNEITREISTMNNPADLFDVLRFVRVTKQYPVGREYTYPGTFNEHGDYVPAF